MLTKNAILGVVLILLTTQCNNKKSFNEDFLLTINSSDLSNIIINDYQKNDSKYFTERENCIFKTELKSIEINQERFFDLRYQNLSYKFMYNIYNDFNYTIIRGSNGKLYYRGISEINFVKNYVKKEYVKQQNKLISKDSSLNVLTFNNKTFNNLLKDDSTFKIPVNKINDQVFMRKKIDLALSAIYHTLLIKGDKDLLRPLFDEIVKFTLLEDELIKLKNNADSLNQEEVDNIYEPVNNLILKNQLGNILIGKIKNFGLIIFVVKYDSLANSLVLDEKIIPQLTRQVEFKTDLDFRGEFPSCN